MRFVAAFAPGEDRSASLVASWQPVDGNHGESDLTLGCQAQRAAVVVDLAQAQLQVLEALAALDGHLGQLAGGPRLREEVGAAVGAEGGARLPRDHPDQHRHPVGHLDERMTVVAGAMPERGQRLGERGGAA